MAEEPDLWSLPTPAAASPAVVKTIDAEMKAALELNSQFSDQRRVAREPIIELPKPALPVVGESKQPIAEKSPEPFSAAAKATKETRPVIKGPLGSEWVQSIETDNPLLTAANAAISSVDTGKERRLFYLFLLVVAGLSVSLLYFTRRSEPAIAPAVTTEAPIIAPVESAPPVVEEPSANVEQPVTVIYGEEEVPAPLPPLPETPAARSEVTPVAPESPATDDRALYNLITRQ
jgi:hypothetical protein